MASVKAAKLQPSGRSGETYVRTSEKSNLLKWRFRDRKTNPRMKLKMYINILLVLLYVLSKWCFWQVQGLQRFLQDRQMLCYFEGPSELQSQESSWKLPIGCQRQNSSSLWGCTQRITKKMAIWQRCRSAGRKQNWVPRLSCIQTGWVTLSVLKSPS